MKKTIVALIALATSYTSLAMDHDVEAQQWCRNVVMGWNLGNSLEASDSETGWGNPLTTKDMIHAVKSQGFNAIRIPVRWGQHCNMTTMDIDATWLARVKEIVGWCLDEDLLVVINTHHDTWLEHYPTLAKKEELNTKLKKLWTSIANAFKDYDGRLAFAGTNEVNPEGNWNLTPTQENYDVQNSFNQTFVDAVRATGGNNLKRNLIVQTFRCNPGLGLSHFTVPTDPTERRLSVEFHYYDPYSYCSGSPESYYYWGFAYADKGTVTPDGNELSLANQFKQIRKAWWEQGLGVVMGEYGCSHHYTTDDRDTQEANEQYYMKCLVGEARKNGFAAFAWDNNAFGNGSEQFGIFRRSGTTATVGASYYLEGIRQGSKENYVETVDYDNEDPDTGSGGKVLWQGEKKLNWGEGLQLHIDKSEFTSFSGSATIVCYYRQDATASNETIQLNYNDWKQFSCTVTTPVVTTTCDGNFSPRNFYGTSGATHITPFTVSGSVLTKLKSSGAIIQGYGVVMTKVVIIDKPATSISLPSLFPSSKGKTFDLRGVEVKSPRKGNVYIVDGKQKVF